MSQETKGIRIHKRYWTTAATLLCHALLSNVGVSQQLLKPENKEVSLTGTIKLVHGFGPPGYGETPKHDARVTYWAIETTLPVAAIPDQADFDCKPTRRLNLSFLGLELQPLMQLPAAKWRDQLVTISGKIHCSDTAGEMTLLYMDVDSIGAVTKH
jgi:hypothetical protein